MPLNRASRLITRVRWRKVAILGIGLLGGSLGMALRRRGLAREVVGFARREATVAEALQAGAVDAASTDLDAVVREADLVVLCTPLGEMAALGGRLKGLLAPGAIVTDVGSVKASVLRALEDPVAAAGGHFVGSHPMAGSERTGVGAGRPDLFEGAVSVITPVATTQPAALAEVEAFWRSLGARPLMMSPETHDELVARSSHLPHLLSTALARYVLAPVHGPSQPQLCATGFRDTTRLACGSPVMWRDIALSNRGAILDALDGLEAVLRQARAVLESGDGEELERFFAGARELREGWAASACKPSGE